jgi:bacillithiol biosynthesis cysteine-adding enzyme BshC
MQESACRADSGPTNLRIESLSFDDIPGQSKIFLAYQKDPVSLKRFYPSAVSSVHELSSRIPEVVENYRTDRDLLCDVLCKQNKGFGAPSEVLSNIELLREPETVAVVTGQQTGLFTGPLYTIYKALSAVRLADRMRAEGRPAVPVFWAATEDHDFDEISIAHTIDENGVPFRVSISADPERSEWPVGSIPLSDSIQETVSDFLEAMQPTEFTAGVRELLSDAWRPGRPIGLAFCSEIARLLGRFGLIVLDPHDSRLKELVAPVYGEAVSHSGEIVQTLIARGNDLVAAGYHAQVLVDERYFPLFWHDDSGRRKALKKTGEGRFRVNGERRELTLHELAKAATNDPGRFSPGVMLRPVVQDYLLPTLCYFGGSAEAAYFAQNSEVYRVLGRPVTPIFHRQSFTIVEKRHSRTLDKFQLGLTDLFTGRNSVLPSLVEKFVDPSIARTFAEVEERINAELGRLDKELSSVDATLAENLAKRRRKILYHISALRAKAYRSAVQRNETANRQLTALFNELVPVGGLQERTLNIATYLNRHGEYFLDWLYESIDLDDKGHRMIIL